MEADRKEKGYNTTLDNRPQLFLDLYPVQDMFSILNDRRQYAQDFAQPLSVEDINGILGLMMITDPEARAEYFRYITVMDRFWMEDHIKRVQADNEARRKKAVAQSKVRK